MVYRSYTYRGYQVLITRRGTPSTVWIYDWEVKEPKSVSRPLVLGSGSDGTERAATMAANQFIDKFIFNLSGSTPGGYKSPGEVLAAYKAGAISRLAAIQYLMTYFSYTQVQASMLLDEDDTDDGVVDDTKYPHVMYDCETGNMYTAYNEVDHLKYTRRGYVHSMSECPVKDNGGGSSDDTGDKHEFAIVGLLMGLWLVSKVI